MFLLRPISQKETSHPMCAAPTSCFYQQHERQLSNHFSFVNSRVLYMVLDFIASVKHRTICCCVRCVNHNHLSLCNLVKMTPCGCLSSPFHHLYFYTNFLSMFLIIISSSNKFDFIFPIILSYTAHEEINCFLI